MKSYLLTYFIFILCVSASLFSQSEEWNLDFEEWNELHETNLLDTIIQNHQAGVPRNWYVNPDNVTEGTGIGRTSDNVSGDYAVTLSGFYSYQVMRITSGTNPIRPGWSIDFKPSKLTGDYKSIFLGVDDTSDSLRAYVDVYLTKYDLISSSRDTIGEGHKILLESNYYQNFEVDINYINSQILPDSVIIVLAKKRFGFGSFSECYECNHVFFDKLQLIPSSVSTTDQNIDQGFRVYPNPVTDQLIIESIKGKNQHFAIYDSTGFLLNEYSLLPYEKRIVQVSNIDSKLLFISDGYEVKKIFLMK